IPGRRLARAPQRARRRAPGARRDGGPGPPAGGRGPGRDALHPRRRPACRRQRRTRPPGPGRLGDPDPQRRGSARLAGQRIMTVAERHSDRVGLIVIDPGLSTTVQDAGRPGYREWGVPPGGAFDRGSADLANALVGNPSTATCAVLELTLVGGVYQAAGPLALALAGAPMEATVDG